MLTMKSEKNTLKFEGKEVKKVTRQRDSRNPHKKYFKYKFEGKEYLQIIIFCC